MLRFADVSSATPESDSLGPTERIRGRSLQRIRQRHLEAFPLCASCLEHGRVTEGAEVDHIVAIRNGGRDVAANRQTLCEPCHEAKTRTDMGYRVSGACNLTGDPIDPAHPWNTNP